MRIPVSRHPSPSRKPDLREGDFLPIPAAEPSVVEAGVLYLVAVPIGNPEDITLRALRILKDVSVIAAEDRKRCEALMQCYGITTPIETLQRREQVDAWQSWLARLHAGHAVALLSDAGMPCIADPGQALVARALAAGLRVSVAPGANAALAALVVSGLPAGQFVFLNFPPRTRTDRAKFFSGLASVTTTMVLYESRSYLLRTLHDLRQVLGAERQIAIACDLTRPTEHVTRGSLAAIVALLGPLNPRGEYALVIGGRPSR